MTMWLSTARTRGGQQYCCPSRCARISACHAGFVASDRSPTICSAAADPRLRCPARRRARPRRARLPVASPAGAVPRASVERRIKPVEIIEKGRLKHLQTRRAGQRSPRRPSQTSTHRPSSTQGQVVAVCPAATHRRLDPAHAAIRAPTAATMLWPAPAPAGSRAGRSACCAAPALALPVRAQPVPPSSCATVAERSARLRPPPASGRTASDATTDRRRHRPCRMVRLDRASKTAMTTPCAAEPIGYTATVGRIGCKKC